MNRQEPRQAKLAAILDRYLELRRSCDALAQRVSARFGTAWHCRPGCSGCCRLGSVCGLEAVVLLRAGSQPAVSETPAADACCPFLHAEQCMVYAERPLICRTHGLPLVSSELTAGEVDCCPLNLPALAESDGLESELVLDLDRLTESLLRLNLAFFLALERAELAGVRFPLADLAATRHLPPELLAASAD